MLNKLAIRGKEIKYKCTPRRVTHKIIPKNKTECFSHCLYCIVGFR